MTLRSFLERCKKMIRSRQAIANMETRYATATSIDLDASDKICIVCREEMLPPILEGRTPTIRGDLPKKLPCGHIFHFRCLRNWLDRQQTCPTWYLIIFHILVVVRC
jgi:E3 ubiquitin-protein ligase synoviolin